MKIFSLLVVSALISTVAFGQSQRLVLAEEFTQASCPPCASQNPAFNALLTTNVSKVTSIKYQTSWPGTDPMNAQNPGEVAARVTLYNVSGVPDSPMDGVEQTGGSYTGAPANYTQAKIDAEYAVPSPFTISLKHWFNAANDSIFIYCDITCTQNVNMTTPKVQIAMVEKTITFTSPPGTNGEKIFENVMRKMYPDANGTTVATSWTSGQKKTITFKAKIPSYVYKKSEIAVVAWIQDNATKNVKQAGFSSAASTPVALAPIADFVGDVTAPCDGLVKFQDQSAIFPTSWLWNFGDGMTSTVKNPVHKYNSNGTYAVTLTSTNSNGSSTPVTKTGYITINLTGTAPTTGADQTVCNGTTVNLSATASGSGALNWYNVAGAMVHSGTTYSPAISGTTSFWVSEMTPNAIKSTGKSGTGAGAMYTAATSTQGLVFDVLNRCTLISVATNAGAAGNRTIQVLDGGGNVVQTKTVNIPAGLSTVNLNFTLDPGTGYIIQPGVNCNLFRDTIGAAYPYNTSGVVNITGNTAAGSPGRYYFFYDWKVQQDPCASPAVKVTIMDTCNLTGINNVSVTNSLSVYPNPGNGLFNASFNAAYGNYTVKVTNTLGQVVYAEELSNFSGTYSREINISSFGKGVYVLSISDSKNTNVKKLITY